MFWRRTQQSEESVDTQATRPAPPSGPTPSSRANFDSALDTLAVFLREIGSAIPSVTASEDEPSDDVAAKFEEWTQHLLMGAPTPSSGKTLADGKRDWGGVKRFTRDYLRKEGAVLSSTLDGLKGALSTLMGRISSTIVEDESGDKNARQELETIQQVVRHGSLEEIQSTVSASVEKIGTLMDSRRERQRAMARELGDRVRSLNLELADAKKEAATDGLTGLDNRRSFDLSLARAQDGHTLFGEQACLMIVDADHFKQVNDTYGHPTGDAVLRVLANTLLRAFPRRGDLVARYGGEEFGIVLRDTGLDDGVRLAERVCEKIKTLRISHDGNDVVMSVSIGVSTSNEAESPEMWIERSDQALYRAKSEGRARVCATS